MFLKNMLIRLYFFSLSLHFQSFKIAQSLIPELAGKQLLLARHSPWQIGDDFWKI